MEVRPGEFLTGSSTEPEVANTTAILTLLLGSDEVARLEADALAQRESLLSEFLAGKTMKDISAQPVALAAEAKQLRAEIETVAYTNYASFLQTSTCIGRTRRAVNETKVHLGSLLHDLPKLAGVAEEFVTVAQHVAEKHEVDRRTMQHYPQLLELLEVPQLMEACVKGRHYERALELQGFARRTHNAHPNVPVLATIVRDVTAWAAIMKQQLVEQLSSDCDTETTIKAVDSLRRLDGDSDELELRLRFLAARDTWMQLGAVAVPTSPLPRFLIGRAERLRTDLFFVVTQYHTLFGAGGDQGGTQALWWFAFRKIDEFVALLESKAKLLTDGEDLAAVMDAALYTASALSRVGLDFSVMLHPLFEMCVEQLFVRRLQIAQHFFVESLQTHNWKLAPDPDAALASAAGEVSLQPPLSLLRHPPLALFANDMLDALNHLRNVALLSLTDVLGDALRHTLAEATAALHAQSARSKTSASIHADMSKEMAEALIPHITAAFKWLFAPPPPAQSE